MRLARIDLARFGMFTERVIDLPTASPDFHLIVGPNEAGKSTLRAAITDLLFGVETRSRFNFLHAYTEMRLGAVIEQDGERSEVVRLKRRNDSLLDASDNPLSDDFLSRYIGDADRAFFEQMFGLDHLQLVNGGEAILNAKDDVAATIFEVSGGLEHVREFRDQLEEEADSLWGPRKSSGRTYYAALEKYEDAERALKEATVRAKTWKELNNAVDDAEEALAAATQRYTELEQARTRLERVRRVAPLISTRRQKLVERKELGEVATLSESANEELDGAQREIAKADTEISKQQALVERAKATIEGLDIDDNLLGREREIEELSAERHRVRGHATDIDKRLGEIRAKRDRVDDLLSDLGWTGVGDEELSERLPSKVLREEISALVMSQGRLQEAMRSAADAVEEKNSVIDGLSSQLEDLDATGPSTQLTDALRTARSLGDVAAQLRKLEGELSEARERQGESLEALVPWRGEPAALMALDLVSDEDARATQDRLQGMRVRDEGLEGQIDETKEAIAQLELRQKQFVREEAIVTFEAVTSARAARDEIWQSIKSEARSVTEVADDYETSVGGADGLADQRFSGAAAVKELEKLQISIEENQLHAKAQTQRLESNKAEKSKESAGWAECMARLGLEEMTSSGYPSWLQRRNEALKRIEVTNRADNDLEALETRMSDATDALVVVLKAENVKAKQLAGLSLAGLVEVAEGVVDRANASRERSANYDEQRREEKQKLKSRQQRASKAAGDMEAWKRSWAAKTKEVNLEEGIETEGATVALEIMNDLSDELRGIDEIIRTRVETMRRDLDAFERQSAELASRVAPDLKDLTHTDIAERLSDRLTEAQTDRQTRSNASQELEDAQKAHEAAHDLRREAEAAIKPMMELAGVDSVEQLRSAVARSDKLRAIDTVIEDTTRDILKSGDGLSLEELEKTVDDEELDTISAKLSDIEVERAEVSAQRDECIKRKDEAVTAREQVAGQDAAAKAEARRQEALADMADATSRFIRTHMGARLLRWAIDRYREEKQGPLLKRAGAIFSTLTLGSFEKLAVDYEGDAPRLMGLRSNGKHVTVDGMSDGTRDQLYLALRVAAVELHLEKNVSLPFIADDLFINFDNERAEAGFEVLGELARHTQVIFLTHHDHLVPISQGAIEGKINVQALVA